MSYKVRVTLSRQSADACGPEPRILLALDKFKGTLTSRQANDALRRGLEQRCTRAVVSTVAIADGGDGTVDAAVDAGYTRLRLPVTGPLGHPVEADVAVRGTRAIAEVASVCGLAALPDGRLDPTGATSRGVGELLLGLSDRGIETVVLGLGGSASTDGGAGMLQALGVRLVDADGTDLDAGGGPLLRLAGIDWSGLDERIRRVNLVAASDVDSPLLGPSGAAHTYAPQKGADEHTVAVLERALHTLVDVLRRSALPTPGATPPEHASRQHGAGAAGGLGYGVRLLGGRIASGADLMLDLVGLPSMLGDADLVVTGEGRLDVQSLRGKAPVAVALAATEAGVPAAGVVGTCTLTDDERTQASLRAVWTLDELDTCTAQSAARSLDALTRIGWEIGDAAHGPPAPDWNDRKRTLNSAMHAATSGGGLDHTQEIQCH